MKKTAIIVPVLVVILVVAILLSASAKTRKLDTDYELTFDGNTAVCKAIVTGERKDDFIQVTMRLKREDVIWKTWYQEGYFQIDMRETCSDLLKGKLYTLEISSIINGAQQPVVSTSRTCPGGTKPTTKPTVPPTTQPTVPPTTIHPTIPPTTQPTVPSSPEKEGSAVIFHGPPFGVGYPEWYPREGEIDHLYWAVKSTGESILVCDEPVIEAMKNDTRIFFVKQNEPTKVYVTAIGDFKNHEFVYESTYGSVSAIRNYTNSSTLLQFVADGKKFVVYDMATGESTVLMEQYHINFAVLYCNDDGTWTEIINFEGQHTEDDSPYTEYIYNWVTGELWEDTAL